jgi:YidC/Oxa1 family membrane protein insertase
MQRMSKILPFFMVFIMISVPGALALYYAVSNLVAVAQQAYLLRQDEEELEEIAESSAPMKQPKPTKADTKPKKAATKRLGGNGGTVVRIVAKDTGRK